MFQEISTTGTLEGEDFQVWTPDAAQVINMARVASVYDAKIGTGVTITRQIGYGFADALDGATYNAYFSDATTATADFTDNYFIYQKGTNKVLFSGQTFFPLGSAAAPSIASSGDSGLTGIYFPGTNIISMSFAGTNRFRFTSTQMLPGLTGDNAVDIGSSAIRFKFGYFYSLRADTRFEMANGTVTDPGLTFSNDKDTGIYYSSGIAFTVGGTLLGAVYATGGWQIGQVDGTAAHNVYGPLEFKQQATPANPNATFNRLYFKSDDKLYKLTSGGAETEVGGSSVTLPGSSTDTAVVRWSGVGGNSLLDSGVTIDASNNVTIPGTVGIGGATASTNYLLNLGTSTGNPLTTNTQYAGISLLSSTSAATSGVFGFGAGVTTADASFTCGLRAQFYALVNAAKGAASTITRDVAFLSNGMPAQGGTGNAVLADAQAFTAGNWGIILATTNPSKFSGPMGIGGANDPNSILYIGATNPITTEAVVAAYVNTSFASTTTTGGAGFRADLTCANASFTMPSMTGIYITAFTKGASATVTRAYSAFLTTQTIGATGNATIADAIPTGNYFIYSTNTNPSVISGPMGIGGVNDTAVIVNVGATNPITGTTQTAVKAVMAGTNAATTAIYGFESAVTTAAASYTCAVRAQIRVAGSTAKGTGSTITRDIGILIDAPTQAASSRNACIADNIGYAGAWFIHSTSTNKSQFTGNMGIVTTASDSIPLNVAGTSATTGATVYTIKAAMTPSNGATTAIYGISTTTTVPNVVNTFALQVGLESDLQGGASSTTTRAIGLKTTITGGGTITNQALWSDNTSFTGNWAINLTSTNPSQFSGRVGVIGAALTSATLNTGNASGNTGATQYGIVNNFTAANDATTAIYGISVSAKSPNNAATYDLLVGINSDVEGGAASTVTRRIGIKSTLTAGGTITNSANFADNTSFTGTWFLHSTSTSPSRIAARLGIGVDATAGAMVYVNAAGLTGVNQFAFYTVFIGTSAATTSIKGYVADVNTAAASYTCADVVAYDGGIYVDNGCTATRATIFDATRGITKHASGAITSQAILADNHSYTGAWAINLASTNPSLFTGFVKIANQADPGAVTDSIAIGSQDISAGNATLSLRVETTVVTETVTSDRTLTIYINGTAYKVCLKS